MAGGDPIHLAPRALPLLFFPLHKWFCPAESNRRKEFDAIESLFFHAVFRPKSREGSHPADFTCLHSKLKLTA